MTVCPKRLFPRRGARRIEQALLGGNHKWPLGRNATGGGRLGCDHLLEGSSKVHRSRLAAARIAPGHRAVQRPIELEDAGSVPEACELTAIAIGERAARYRQQLPGPH